MIKPLAVFLFFLAPLLLDGCATRVGPGGQKEMRFEPRYLAKTEIVNLPENDEWIRRIAAKARLVVVGWGVPGLKSGRAEAVEKILLEVCDPAKVFCFGRNKDGSPKHPLYQRTAAPLVPYFSD